MQLVLKKLKVTLGLLVLAVCGLLGSNAAAETFVFTGSGAGSVEVFETAQTGRQFYNSIRNSQNITPADGINLFFHRNTNNGTLSVLFFANRRLDGTGGSLTGEFTNLGANATVTRSDDRGELTISSPGVAVFDFTFIGCCVDGGVISGLNPNDVSFNFNITSSSGLSTVNLLGPNGFTTIGTPGPGFALVANNPEPQAWALFILSFIGIAVKLKHERKNYTQSPKNSFINLHANTTA